MALLVTTPLGKKSNPNIDSKLMISMKIVFLKNIYDVIEFINLDNLLTDL